MKVIKANTLILASAVVCGSLISHANNAKVAAGIWSVVTLSSGSVPSTNPGSTQRHALSPPFPTVSSTSSAVIPATYCEQPYTAVCAYEVNASNQIIAVYYGTYMP